MLCLVVCFWFFPLVLQGHRSQFLLQESGRKQHEHETRLPPSGKALETEWKGMLCNEGFFKFIFIFLNKSKTIIVIIVFFSGCVLGNCMAGQSMSSSAVMSPWYPKRVMRESCCNYGEGVLHQLQPPLLPLESPRKQETYIITNLKALSNYRCGNCNQWELSLPP